MKVLSYQIRTIMHLAAQHRAEAPQFLDLLNAIVKVEELNLPLKRNQGELTILHLCQNSLILQTNTYAKLRSRRVSNYRAFQCGDDVI